MARAINRIPEPVLPDPAKELDKITVLAHHGNTWMHLSARLPDDMVVRLASYSLRHGSDAHDVLRRLRDYAGLTVTRDTSAR